MCVYGLSPDTVYLSPAQFHHAAPLGFCLHTQFEGGTAARELQVGA